MDEALEELGLGRKIALVTPRFVAVPFLVAGAAVVTTMHAKLARYFAEKLGLSLSPPPVELPELKTWLLWHASYDTDLAHIWLRDTIIRVAAGARDKDGQGAQQGALMITPQTVCSTLTAKSVVGESAVGPSRHLAVVCLRVRCRHD